MDVTPPDAESLSFSRDSNPFEFYREIRNEIGKWWRVEGGKELQQQLEEIRATIEIKRNRYSERRKRKVPLCRLGGGYGGKSFISR